MERLAKSYGAALVLLVTLAAPAAAQNAAPTQPPCSSQNGDSSGKNLSDKLGQSGGVLCPPGNVDPQMKAPAPHDGGNTPVIPPPGSPGGDPNVQPK